MEKGLFYRYKGVLEDRRFLDMAFLWAQAVLGITLVLGVLGV
jgi:hypothetical protein